MSPERLRNAWATMMLNIIDTMSNENARKKIINCAKRMAKGPTKETATLNLTRSGPSRAGTASQAQSHARHMGNDESNQDTIIRLWQQNISHCAGSSKAVIPSESYTLL